jgi:hypothetical protein
MRMVRRIESEITKTISQKVSFFGGMKMVRLRQSQIGKTVSVSAETVN